MVKNSFIEKTYVVGTHSNRLIEATTYVTENEEENYLEIYIFQVSCPFSLPLLNHLKLPISIKIPVAVYLHDGYSSSTTFFANLVVAWL